jgi:adenosylcobinamide kinase/adenosylcobinamide-phosphate guanylyltransferase
MIELYLGGARSGKSRLAEQRALSSGQKCIYLATAEAGDDEMARRIQHHRDNRSTQWTTLEEPLLLAERLREYDSPGHCIVVDCLTLWLSNLLASSQADHLASERKALFDLLPNLSGHIIFVSNEVGQGIIPLGEISRRFVDESGFLHQDLAVLSDRVVFVVAGLPQLLKGVEA